MTVFADELVKAFNGRRQREFGGIGNQRHEELVLFVQVKGKNALNGTSRYRRPYSFGPAQLLDQFHDDSVLRQHAVNEQFSGCRIPWPFVQRTLFCKSVRNQFLFTPVNQHSLRRIFQCVFMILDCTNECRDKSIQTVKHVRVVAPDCFQRLLF